ncbi:MAG: Mitochondrial inner membrane protease atp23 [Thelocarpon impressellum]|nr:MAG: Mitochondrial inner membrane protease atp23 [Thelocarpon impressellum]
MADSHSSKDADGGSRESQEDTYTWQNWFRILGGRMSEDGMQQFKLDKDARNEAVDCKRCDEWKEYLFKYSPIIRFMQQNVSQLHGDINGSNVRCRRCTTFQSGGFHPDHGIQICANELRNRGHLEDTLAHEMVHAYDHLRFRVDWIGDLRHAACSEIRASSLSGECRWTREFFTRGQYNLTQQHQACVRRRAVASVMNRPFCRDRAQAVKAVDEVWDSCFADTRPFDEIYR